MRRAVNCVWKRRSVDQGGLPTAWFGGGRRCTDGALWSSVVFCGFDVWGVLGGFH